MEPMTLGSPSGPGGSSAGYLPSFLMGDPPTTPRPNTLSPTRGRSSLAYSHGMAGSPPEGLRSPPILQQSQHHQQYPGQFSSPFALPHQQQQQQQHAQRFLQNSTAQASTLANQYRNESFDANASTAGPPTQGLFDSWRKEKQLLHTPIRGPPVQDVASHNLSFNESLQNQSAFNASRVMSPIPHTTDFNRTTNLPSPSSYESGGKQEQQEHSNWVTVFGFPQNATSIILSHFMGIGTILDKQPALQGGNWIHLRYSSRIECNRAINFNGRIVSPGLMVGVQYCTDSSITGKENDADAVDRSQKPFSRVRSLMDVSYTSKQQENAVVGSPIAAKRSNGIVNKAMDLFFGW
ncbi:AGAP008619-PA-like protein [Anopheles sinensis]|uniref:Nucleoporin NUP53 n=1 Tax=Anopheles sinensis TaxID=74873 RepID=A0A084WFX4_ANOSI|nr:AGAP008619-PA-like protein [Anopheles sinensis]